MSDGDGCRLLSQGGGCWLLMSDGNGYRLLSQGGDGCRLLNNGCVRCRFKICWLNAWWLWEVVKKVICGRRREIVRVRGVRRVREVMRLHDGMMLDGALRLQYGRLLMLDGRLRMLDGAQRLQYGRLLMLDGRLRLDGDLRLHLRVKKC